MGLLSDAGKLINPRSRRGTLRERCGHLQDKLANLEKENADLHREVSKLRTENEAVTAMMARMLSARAEYVEFRGALWKRKRSGEFGQTVYCRRCRAPFPPLQVGVPCRCARCKTALDFNGQELPQIMTELSKKYPQNLARAL